MIILYCQGVMANKNLLNNVKTEGLKDNFIIFKFIINH